MEAAKEAGLEAKSAAEAKATWRKLSVNDLENLICVANEIHPDLPESIDVFAERIKLFPEGCLALVGSEGEGEGNKLCGYAVSHPIIRRQPPALNSLLGAISPNANQYYIHDLALLPKARGHGHAQECIDNLLAIAERYSTTSLVSVYDSATFWNRSGFMPGEIDGNLEKKLRGYGGHATYLERKNVNYEGQTEMVHDQSAS